MKALKTVLKILGIAIGAVLIAAAVFVAYLSITEYKPEQITEIEVRNEGSLKLSKGDSLKILSFNTGYAGLGKEADSFLDGGKNVETGDESTVWKNLTGIEDIIKSADADIYILQETDISSKRSYKIDQTKFYMEENGLSGAFAYNYNCNFVPYPLPPIGKVKSGLLTLTALETEGAQRISLPCPFKWPVSAANLKRCLLVTRYSLENSESELVVVNLHLEAYDDNEGKIAQTKMLWEIISAEYEKGNYVIAGGDFNQAFPRTVEKYPIKNSGLWVPGTLGEEALLEGWSYVFDESTPTCRLLNQPYEPESEATQFFVIDGFIISPNVELKSVKTMDESFEFSDHNPVLMEAVLK